MMASLELLLLLVLLQLSAYCGNSEVDVRLLSKPHAVSTRDFAAFQFEVIANGQSSNDLHSAICKLDDELPSACNASAVYPLLPDGYHSFEVCTNGTQGVGCASHNWTVDTVPPTAYLTASTSFTRSSNVQINITFSEPCGGKNGGFHCSSPQACNLLVYGDGWILPNTLAVLEPDLKYSLTVNLSTRVRFGKVKIVMDKDVCTDSAGNMFTRTDNSSMVIHFDRRRIIANLSTHVPEKIVMIENENRSVLATNKKRSLRICLYFLEPVLNSSAEIMASLYTSNGSLVPVNFGTFGMRRFGYWVRNISFHAIISVHLDSQRVLTQLGTPVPLVNPVTFLYDSQRPGVKIQSKSNTMAGNEIVPVVIDFMEPVFGFNASCIGCISISGGKMTSFDEVSSSVYEIGVTANSSTYGGLVRISIPENVTQDISGNPNNRSEILEFRHYPLPPGFDAFATVPTAAFAATALMTGFLTVSTASLQSAGAASPPMAPDPAKSVFRMAGHIQVYALSKWLAADLPVEYSQFTKGLQWTIPYLRLPWEKHQLKVSSGPPMDLIHDLGAPQDLMHDVFTTIRGPKFFGLPLNPLEYKKFFEERKTDMVEEEHYVNKGRWAEFTKSMFWLGIFYGTLVLLHAILYLLIWFRKEDVKTDNERNRGPIFLPRFEIFLLLLGLPCLCQASTSLVKGWHSPEMVAGILLLATVFFLLLALFLFLTIGILTRERVRYDEKPHEEHHYLLRIKKIVEIMFGQRKKGVWIPENDDYSRYYTMLGPIFDELRGPPSPENAQSQTSYKKLFGIFRIYQAFLEAGKKVVMGIVAGAELEGNSSKASTIILLCITAFQLLFMMLTNPFIARRMQFVEIFSALCELGIFVACVFMLEGDISDKGEKKIGIFMIALFVLPFIAQLLNEWYGLFGHARELDPEHKNFWSGLKVASVGFLLLFFPRRWIRKWIKDFDKLFPPTPNDGVVEQRKGDTGSITSGDVSSDKKVITEESKMTSQQDPALASHEEHIKDIKGEVNANTTVISGDTDSAKEVIAEEPKITN